MLKYIVRRLLYTLLTLFIMSIIIFMLVHILPGDPAMIILGPDATAEQIAKLQDLMGFNKPIYVQYFTWIGNAVQGDLGISFYNNAPIYDEIMPRLKSSVSIAVMAQLIAVLIAIPFGVISAKNKGGKADNAITLFSLAGVSIPNFLLSLFFILLFAVTWKILPASGYGSLDKNSWNYIKYIIMPVFALGLPQAALLTRMTKSTMLDIINMDFIRTENAKGMTSRTVLYKHALRNALVPILTIVGNTFGVLIAGTAIVETLFNIPGIGYIILSSISKRDYPLLQALLLVVSVIYILITLAIDLLYGVIDPRIKLTGERE